MDGNKKRGSDGREGKWMERKEERKEAVFREKE